MTKLINNENNNMILSENMANKENLHNNLEDFINKKNIPAKNHTKIQINPITKGLSILDQNNNCIKKTENPNAINAPCMIPLRLDINSKCILPNLNNNIFNNPNLINENIFMEEPKEESNDGNMELCSNSEIEMASSEKKENCDKNENILLLSSPFFLENDYVSQSEFKEFEKKIQKPIEIPNININRMFYRRESDHLLLKCGESSYKYNKCLEETTFKIPPTFLNRHNITPQIRTKMVDWMIEVLSIFDNNEETFFLAVNIMDLFLWKTPTIYRSENVHLIGIASMFISSKFQEIYPIPLKDFVEKIGHNQYCEDDIKKIECKILKDIKTESLVSTSVYDFCKTYFYDFYYNNKNLITTEEDAKIYQFIKLTSVYLNKLIMHYEAFYQENCSIKAIGCIVTSMKIIGDSLKEKFGPKARGIYNDWMLFLIEQGGFDKQKVEKIAKKIYTAYEHYQKSKTLGKNLNRFCKLPFKKSF